MPLRYVDPDASRSSFYRACESFGRSSLGQYLHDGADPILIASNFGGPKHPQWYFNLVAHPECALGGDDFVVTEVIDPSDYARVYERAERVYGGWTDYKAKVALTDRRIPMFRLKPRV